MRIRLKVAVVDVRSGSWDIGADEFISAGGAVLKYYNGSSWVTKPIKYYNGSSWTTKTLKYYNGSSWV